MAKRVGVSMLALELEGLLKEETSMVLQVTEEAVKHVAQSTVKQIREEVKIQFPDGTGDYAKSWAQKVDTSSKARGKIDRIVYSRKPNYRLTHLLENGHAKVNGGRVEGRPHIAPAEQASERLIMYLIKKGIQQGGL